MANRQPARPPPASQVPSSARQNEYFVPRDGIDREVITSDICRYLGNDALVRPGTYEAADGRVTQGYFITAYRNLTSAMIQDLKADSARWEQERRAAARTSGGGTGGSREPRSGQPDYVSWKNSQDAYRGGDRMDVEYAAQPPVANPGYGGAPYGGAPPAHGYPAQAPYPPPGQSGSAPPYGQPYGYPPNPSQYSPGPHPGAAPAPPPISQVAPVGYPQDPASYYPGGNFSSQPGYPVPPSRMTPLSSAPSSRGFGGVTAGPGYAEQDAFGYGSGAPMPFSSLQNPADPVYGRAPGGAYNTAATNPSQVPSDDLGSPAGTAPPRQGYSAGPEPPFDDRQSPTPNASTPTNGPPSQIPATGPPPARRDTDMRDRDRDRDPRDHRARRPEEDRHAAERARHRQGRH
ncbi:hypothetical protein OQA88_4482 [Cercophora sp. LCS_1]